MHKVNPHKANLHKVDGHLFSQRFVGCIATLGVVGGTSMMALHPGLAQQSPENHRIMAQASALSGSWRLVALGSPDSPAAVPQTTELTVDFTEDRISGSGGCNRFMGGYQTPQAGTLSIEPLASTSKACEPPIMNQETRYLQALQAAQRYEVDGQKLTIFYQTEQESGVLRFTAQTIRGLW